MRPSFLDDMAWSMADVYASVTDRILINLAKYFPLISQGGEVLDDFNYQARMLAQMGQVNKETIAIIAQSLGGADEALKETIEAAIIEALKKEEPQLRKAAEAGLLRGAVDVSPNQMQAFRAYYQQAADKLNLVNTVMLESTQAAYTATVADVAQRIQRSQSYLNVAAGEVVTGVSSYNAAMHDAVQKMVKNGLTGFIDHGGHKWSPEAYVAMDIRTTLFNTSRAAIWERNQQYGNDLYQVSTHNGARPLCYPWQGKVISTSGRTGMTEDLDGNTIAIHAESEIESFRYGGGLFGVNCGHYPMTFIPGFSTIKGEPQDPEENAKTYSESQQQRALERKLREEKRDLEVMKAQGASPEEIKAQRARVKQADANIKQFCDETGRARRKDREYAPVKAEWPDTGNPPQNPTAERDKMWESVKGENQQETIRYNEKNIRNYTPDIKHAVEDSVKTKNQKLIETINNTSDKCTIEWVDGEGTDHYSYGTGKITMYTQKFGEQQNLDTMMQTRWHEYFHFVDDAEVSGSGYYVERNGYRFNGITAMAKQNGQYARAAADDINAFFKRRDIDGVYECVVDGNSRWIYKNGVPIDTNDFATCNELNNHLLDWLDEASGLKKAYSYLDDIGYPKSPDYNDYFETYFTPKRHTLKTREKYKGAEYDFIKANESVGKAREEFEKTHDMNRIFKEQKRLREEAEEAKKMLAPVTDTFDGGAFGAFMSPICGGHSANYYSYNDNGIREGVANIGSCLVTENATTIKGMNDICPNTFKLISNIITGQNQ